MSEISHIVSWVRRPCRRLLSVLPGLQPPFISNLPALVTGVPFQRAHLIESWRGAYSRVFEMVSEGKMLVKKHAFFFDGLPEIYKKTDSWWVFCCGAQDFTCICSSLPIHSLFDRYEASMFQTYCWHGLQRGDLELCAAQHFDGTPFASDNCLSFCHEGFAFLVWQVTASKSSVEIVCVCVKHIGLTKWDYEQAVWIGASTTTSLLCSEAMWVTQYCISMRCFLYPSRYHSIFEQTLS